MLFRRPESHAPQPDQSLWCAIWSGSVKRCLAALRVGLVLALLYSGGVAGSAGTPQVRWSFWVPPARLADFAPVFGAQIAPLLARHGFVDPQPDRRTVPDSLFNRVYAVPSRPSFEAMRAAVEADSAWLALMGQLGARFRRGDADGRLQRMVALYSDPAGPGNKRYAPPDRVVPVGPGKGHWITYGVPEGLPGLDIQHLFEDRAGHIWVSTWGSGISRWDGEGFTTFTPENGLAGLRPRYTMQDQQGHIWIGLADGGLSRWDGETMVAFGPTDGVPEGILSIMEDRRGHLWMPTEQGPLRYDGQRFHTYGPAIEGGKWRTMHEDRQGRLWVAAHDGVWRWNGEGPVRFDFVGPPENANRFIEDRGGAIWVLGWQGVGRYDGGAWTTVTGEGGSLAAVGSAQPGWGYFWDLEEDRQGHIWLLSSAEGPSVAFRWDGSRWSILGQDRGLSDWTLSLLADPDGSMWFTSASGLQRWDGTALMTYGTADGLDNDDVRTILVDRRNDLWAGTIGNLSRFDSRHFANFRTEHGLPHDSGGGASRDGEGHLWFINNRSATRYDGQTFASWTEEDFAYLPPSQDRRGALWFATGHPHILCMRGDTLATAAPAEGLPGWTGHVIEGPSGALWISGGFGLARYDGQTFDYFTVQDGLHPGHVGSALFDHDGRLWLNQGRVQTVYDGTRFAPSGLEAHLPPDAMRARFVDRDGHIWFGSDGRGLSRWDGQHLVRYTTQDGLAHNAIRAIYQSRDGHLWVGTDGGVVSRFDGRVFQTLSRRDGLNGQSVRAIVQDEDGAMWFSTYQGVIRYQPPAPTQPEIFVTAVVADRRYEKPQAVAIPSTSGLVAFEFQGRSLMTPPDSHVYLYRLQGHETDWQQTRARRVEYTDLPVGQYKFELIAVDRDLTYSDTTAVEVEVFHQITAHPYRIAELQFDDLFASFYPAYARHPFGTVTLANDAPDTAGVLLRLFLPDFMRRPLERPITLPPRSAQTIPLTAHLDPAVLEVLETVHTPAEVELSFAQGDQTIAVRQNHQITIHRRGDLIWDRAARAAAFITSDDPSLAAFARPLLAAFEAEAGSLGQPVRNLIQAMTLFEGLKAHGIRYLTDANTPYSRVAADRGAVDHVRYPVETLQYKAGDCDDLTVLYAALLENAGIATALVDYPGHIFLLFDSGIRWQQDHTLPLAKHDFVTRGDRLWIPVEITRLGDSFRQAWQAGLEELAKLTHVERIQRVVDTADAWERFPVAQPDFSVQLAGPPLSVLEEAFAAQYDTLKTTIGAHIETHYLDPLKLQPDNDALRLRLIQLYLVLRRYDTAIHTAESHLLDEVGDKAATYNQLGVAYYLKGEDTRAALNFKQAIALRPEDRKLQRNLDLALQKLGKSDAATAAQLADSKSDDQPKGAVSPVGVDDFYWFE